MDVVAARRIDLDRSAAGRCPSSVFGRPGGISGEPVPDPIPNSAVKLPSANGTSAQDLEEKVVARPAKDGNLFTIENPCVREPREKAAAALPRRLFAFW